MECLGKWYRYRTPTLTEGVVCHESWWNCSTDMGIKASQTKFQHSDGLLMFRLAEMRLAGIFKIQYSTPSHKCPTTGRPAASCSEIPTDCSSGYYTGLWAPMELKCRSSVTLDRVCGCNTTGGWTHVVIATPRKDKQLVDWCWSLWWGWLPGGQCCPPGWQREDRSELV